MTVSIQAKKTDIKACTLLLVLLLFGLSGTFAKKAPGMPFSAQMIHHAIASDTGNIVALTEFGVKPNSFENASAGVKKALAFCKEKSADTLLLPGGRIDLWPEYGFKRELYISNCTEDDSLSKIKNIGFLLDGFKNLVVEGNNTLVVLHGKMVSFAILNSKNIQLKNIRFDYERPTISELSILKVAPNILKLSFIPIQNTQLITGALLFMVKGGKANLITLYFSSPIKT